LTTSFGALGVSAELTETLAAQGITQPFAIQALVLADALAGRDVCGKAKTGSGKTLAFGLPLLQRVGRAESCRPRALVLVPTRELARQVADVLEPLAGVLGKRLTVCYGGTGMDSQIKALHRGVEVVVATPGRLIDLLQRGLVDLGAVEVMVLDEADRMADMGFMPPVEWVLRRLPADRQTMLFSATLDGDVDSLIRHYLRDPVRHEVASESATVTAMEHRFLLVHQLDKVKVTAAIASAAKRTLIFTRTKRGADHLCRDLRREGVDVAAIHGDLRQQMRERALKDFADGRLAVLVATDVAARGIHVDGIDIVVHYDPPEDQKAYLHRSGRTARAGEEGLVVTLVLWDQQHDVERIQRRLGISQPVVEVFSNDPRLGDLRSWDPARASVA
jgi:superfamily II DNA/RNA helicase